MGTRMTIDQLEQMKTHELADLLANVVLLLRRMPDVACKQLVQPVPGNEFLDPPKVEQGAMPAASLTREGLAKRKVAELKTLAKELNVFFSAPIKKDDLVTKILAKSADGYSEQRAIRELKGDVKTRWLLVTAWHAWFRNSYKKTLQGILCLLSIFPQRLLPVTVMHLRHLSSGLIHSYLHSASCPELGTHYITLLAYNLSP